MYRLKTTTTAATRTYLPINVTGGNIDVALAVNRQSDSQADRRRATVRLMERGEGKTLRRRWIVAQIKAETCAIAIAFVSPKIQAPRPLSLLSCPISIDKR